MKKLRYSFLIMAVLAAVCFTACTNKDDDDKDLKSAIVTPKYRGGGIACTIQPQPSITLSDDSKLLSIAVLAVDRPRDFVFKLEFYLRHAQAYHAAALGLRIEQTDDVFLQRRRRVRISDECRFDHAVGEKAVVLVVEKFDAADSL